MKIGLLECDHVAERFRHLAGDYREMFGALFQPYAPSLSLIPFDVCNGEWPTSFDVCDGYLCTGSRFSVYDNVAWIHRLKAFVRQLYATQKPFVGICFGHQMLAEALGGQVAKAQTGWGVGQHAVAVQQREAWMQPARTSFQLQYMHQDQVVRLPERGVLLGQSAHCPVAFFRVGQTMLGIQAHPEFPAAYSEALLLDRRARIGAAQVETARRSLAQPGDEQVVAQWMANFLNGIQSC